jgi:hypothetical protein
LNNGPTFSINNITEHLDKVNLVCIHGNLVVLKAVLQKFIISSDEETARQYAQAQQTLPPTPTIQQPNRNQFSPETSTSFSPPPSYQEVSAIPVYSGVIIEDKDGHNQHFQ